jgi:hypothetical protein
VTGRVLDVDEVALILAEAQPNTLPVVTAVKLAHALAAAGYRVVANRDAVETGAGVHRDGVSGEALPATDREEMRDGEWAGERGGAPRG